MDDRRRQLDARNYRSWGSVRWSSRGTRRRHLLLASVVRGKSSDLPPPLVVRVTQASDVNRLAATFELADRRHRVHVGKGISPISEAVVMLQAETAGAVALGTPSDRAFPHANMLGLFRHPA